MAKNVIISADEASLNLSATNESQIITVEASASGYDEDISGSSTQKNKVTVKADQLDSLITTGSMADSVSIKGNNHDKLIVDTGAGDDKVTVKSIDSEIDILLGMGDDKVTAKISGATSDLDVTSVSGSSKAKLTAMDHGDLTADFGDGAINAKVTAKMNSNAELILNEGVHKVSLKSDASVVTLDATANSQSTSVKASSKNGSELNVETGSGHDNLKINSALTDLTVDSGLGDDVIKAKIKDVGSAHAHSIDAGGGNDSLNIKVSDADVDVDLGLGVDSLSIKATKGSDVTITGSGIDGNNIQARSSKDSIFDITTDAGDDTIYFKGSKSDETIFTVDSGAGDDTITVSGSSYDLNINAGTGHDTINIKGSNLTGTIDVSGDNVADVLNFTGKGFSGNVIGHDKSVSRVTFKQGMGTLDLDNIRAEFSTSNLTVNLDNSDVIFGERDEFGELVEFGELDEFGEIIEVGDSLRDIRVNVTGSDSDLVGFNASSRIYTANGNDVVNLAGTIEGKLDLILGLGDDTVNVSGSLSSTMLYVNGQGGLGTFNSTGNIHMGELQIDSFNEINLIDNIDGAFIGGVDGINGNGAVNLINGLLLEQSQGAVVTFGDMSDTVNLADNLGAAVGAEFTNATLNFNGGNDSIRLIDGMTFAGVLNGGAGFDELVLEDGAFTGGKTNLIDDSARLTSIESIDLSDGNSSYINTAVFADTEKITITLEADAGDRIYGVDALGYNGNEVGIWDYDDIPDTDGFTSITNGVVTVRFDNDLNIVGQGTEGAYLVFT